MEDFITYGMTDDHILMLVGKQLKQMRINAGIRQEDLSVASGLTRKTISSIEYGKSTSTGNIIALLRGLNKLDILSVFSTPVPISPIAVAKAGRAPQRVRSNKTPKGIEQREW